MKDIVRLLAQIACWPHASHTLWAVPHIHVSAKSVTMLKRSFALLLAVATVLVSHACKHWDEWPRNKYMQLHPVLQIRRAGLYGLIMWGAALMGSEDVICP